MIKAVLFDLDGTVLNRDASLLKFIDNQYDRLGGWLGHIPKEEYISRFVELDCRGYVWKDKVYEQITNEFRISNISSETLLNDYMTEFRNNCTPFPHLLRTLGELKKQSIRLGIITNGKGAFQMNNIRALGIEKYFDTILVSEKEGIQKPNPEIFHRALRRLNTSADKSIYVGDHPENDVNGAKQIGMIGIWKRDKQWKNVEADFMIDDLHELVDIVKDYNTVN